MARARRPAPPRHPRAQAAGGGTLELAAHAVRDAQARRDFGGGKLASYTDSLSDLASPRQAHDATWCRSAAPPARPPGVAIHRHDGPRAPSSAAGRGAAAGGRAPARGAAKAAAAGRGALSSEVSTRPGMRRRAAAPDGHVGQGPAAALDPLSESVQFGSDRRRRRRDDLVVCREVRGEGGSVPPAGWAALGPRRVRGRRASGQVDHEPFPPSLHTAPLPGGPSSALLVCGAHRVVTPSSLN